MEKYCVSLEIAKKLVEAGFKKETKFWWWKTYDTKEWKVYQKSDKSTTQDIYPAPLSDEILEEFDSWEDDLIFIFRDCFVVIHSNNILLATTRPIFLPAPRQRTAFRHISISFRQPQGRINS